MKDIPFHDFIIYKDQPKQFGTTDSVVSLMEA